MSYPKLLLSLLTLGLLVPLAGHSQVVTPLTVDKSRQSVIRTPPVARRGTAVTLPLFDDFAPQGEGLPKPLFWEPGGGTLVNNRFPVAPPSRGVVTFDGLSATGQPYGSSSAYNDTDTLTSQPIDLSGLTAASGVYLSFFWQSGSIVGPPKANTGSQPVRLELEMLDNTGLWQQVWVQLSTGARTNFQQQLVAVDQARYLHSAFQFRWRATGNLANTRDAWSLDYILLNRGRSATDNSYRDIAISAPLTSLLRRFAAMPIEQFNANAASELNSNTLTTINNFDVGPAPTPITWTGTLQVLPSGPRATFLTGNKSLSARQQQDVIAGDVRISPLPNTPEAKRITHRIAIQTNETNPLTLSNDTISRITELADYYAYDDGSAEATVSLPALSTGPASYLAYRFDLNRPDRVRSVRIYPSPTGVSRVITMNVWDQDPLTNLPTAEPKASQTFTIPASLPAGQAFVDIAFSQPVNVTGTFYVGYGQASLGFFIPFGIDLNSTVPEGYLLTNAANAWTATSTTPAGAPLIRPVMAGSIITATSNPLLAASISVYPNPSAGLVRVEGRYLRVTVLDAVGRTIWEKADVQTGQSELDLRNLPSGVYMARFLLPQGEVVTKRIALN
ncbi:T9SS type A sorting domain-containing protein [Hymenobacter sp. HDW8]|uniref:T9SS type A sorting domain-containing protein n=1 Tax=Hymenobacter sp. HDW8 TaxID=2714932 RepID=UPI0014089FB9|nr:T9SS type A sorting domain-containing protein [Hymenobacter sp. HDW8]QIL77519.1 T9SS type A sorting domain-containing protein [Hymenobacter sp. HDW8]